MIERLIDDLFDNSGISFYWQSPETLNITLERRGVKYPCAIAYPIETLQLTTVSGNFRERLQLAVFFVQPTKFDFNEKANWGLIEQCQTLAYKWLRDAYQYPYLKVVQVNGTSRVYDNTDVILTGFGLNITLEEVFGSPIPCEDVLKVKRFGEWSDLMIYDGRRWEKVRANG